MSDRKPILFATDGSPSAAEAQATAIELARALDAPLVAVSVKKLALPAYGYAGYGYANAVAEMSEAEQKRVDELLTEVRAVADDAGVACSAVAGDGHAADEICRLAREHDAQMIVVGSHGWGAARRLFSGSVSTALVHSAPCPVLVVRPSAQAVERAAAA